MKWQAWSQYSRKEYAALALKKSQEWHAKFAWRPIRIPRAVYDGIAVPCHYVWLESYEARSTDLKLSWRPGIEWRPSNFVRRPYTGQPTLRELMRAP